MANRTVDLCLIGKIILNKQVSLQHIHAFFDIVHGVIEGNVVIPSE